MVDKAAQQTKGQKVDIKPRRCKKIGLVNYPGGVVGEKI